MRNTLLVLSGLLLTALVAGCSSGGDGGAVNELTADVDMLEMDLAAARAELATTKAELEDAEGDLATAQASLATARNSLSTTEADLTAARSELATANADLEDAENDLATARTTLSTKETELAAATARLEVLEASQTTTQADLATARRDLAMAREELRTAQNTLTTRTTELTAAQAQVTTLTAQVASLRTQLGQAQDTTEDLQEEVTELQTGVSSLEANTRAESMLEVLEDITTPMGGAERFSSPRVDTRVRTRGRLTIEAPGYTTATVSTGTTGFGSARMTRTVGGSEQEIVVYTDREVSRNLLAHFGGSRVETQGTEKNIEGARLLASEIASFSSTADLNAPANSNQAWRVTHGFPASVPATEEGTGGAEGVDRERTRSVTTLSGSLYGVPGTFECSSPPCSFALTATYNDDAPSMVTTTENRLDMVTLAGAANYYFRPSPSAVVQLYEGGDLGADGQYVVFGWWKNTPEVTTGAYDFEVFAATNDASTVFGGNVTGSYDGPAVGAYVEQVFLAGESGGHRHGEFTATAQLTATGTATTGYVDGFRATQEGSGAAVAKNWRVDLLAGNLVGIRLSGLNREADGGWDVDYLANHTTSGLTQPVTGVGHFAASVESLEVVGAFGVRRVSPQ